MAFFVSHKCIKIYCDILRRLEHLHIRTWWFWCHRFYLMTISCSDIHFEWFILKFPFRKMETCRTVSNVFVKYLQTLKFPIQIRQMVTVFGGSHQQTHTAFLSDMNLEFQSFDEASKFDLNFFRRISMANSACLSIYIYVMYFHLCTFEKQKKSNRSDNIKQIFNKSIDV